MSMNGSKNHFKKSTLIAGGIVFILSVSLISAYARAEAPASADSAAKNLPATGLLPAGPGTPKINAPDRTVSLTKPKHQTWASVIEAHGNILPWQEIHISAEVDGLRVVSVIANLGDVVKKGQVLARLNSSSVETELDAANAQLNEAKAAQGQAAATLERAGRLAPSGGISKQELTLYETQKRTADARLSAALAHVKKQQLRLEQATLLAPDDGMISSRSIVEGTIVQSGNELFRMIRQGRLQWRAEVPGDILLKLATGQEATVKSPLGETIKGRVRQISPTVDLATQKGWVYVDIPTDTNLKSGLSVSGTLTIGKRQVLTVPLSALQNRGGVPTLFSVNRDSKVESIEVKTGETRNNQIEITSGLESQTSIIASDLDVLSPGDTVDSQATKKMKASTE